MQVFKKAYVVIPHWADEQDPEKVKALDGAYPTYADNPGKAKYEFSLHIEYDNKDWFKFRALRWKEKDLFPPQPHEILEELSNEQISKMKHTYGVESSHPGYRNYYNCSAADKDFLDLIERGLTERDDSVDKMLHDGNTYFRLTELGKAIILTTRERLREDINGTK